MAGDDTLSRGGLQTPWGIILLGEDILNVKNVSETLKEGGKGLTSRTLYGRASINSRLRDCGVLRRVS